MKGHRMSSLPSTEYCGGSQTLLDCESTRAKRSTVFHHFCATGEWVGLEELPLSDREEIGLWHRPAPERLGHTELDPVDADKELEVGLTTSGDYCDASHPDLLTLGHLDMAWSGVPFEGGSLSVVVDLKSSVFAAQDGPQTLQLAAYGLAYAQLKGDTHYLPAIWDLSAGRYHFGKVVALDSWEGEELKGRVLRAASNKGEKLVTGPHCSGCFKRSGCPAHLVGLPSDHDLAKVLVKDPDDAQLERAAVLAKQLKDSAKKLEDFVSDALKSHGPIQSADGKRRLALVESPGRRSLDQRALKAALGDLKPFQKEGAPFPVKRWVSK